MTWGCSVWSQVSGSAVGTSGRFPEGAHKVQAAFPDLCNNKDPAQQR